MGKLNVLILMIVLGSSQAHAQIKSEFSDRFRIAYANLCKDYANSALSYTLKRSVVFNGSTEYSYESPVLLVNYEDEYVSDKQQKGLIYSSKMNNSRMSVPENTVQHIKLSNRRLISARYEIDAAGKQLQSAYVVPDASHYDQMLMLFNAIKMNAIFHLLEDLQMPIEEYYILVPDQVDSNPANRTQTAIYNLAMGKLEIVIFEQQSTYHIVNAKLTQSSNDQYSFLDHAKLHDRAGRLLGGKSHITVSRINSIKIERDYTLSHRPIIRLVSTSTTKSELATQITVNELTLKSRVALKSVDEFHKYHVQIPDGYKVRSADPAYTRLDLSYRNGQVVRSTDSASLEDVIIEAKHQSTSRVYVIVGVVVGSIIIISTAFIVILRLRKHRLSRSQQ